MYSEQISFLLSFGFNFLLFLCVKKSMAGDRGEVCMFHKSRQLILCQHTALNVKREICVSNCKFPWENIRHDVVVAVVVVAVVTVRTVPKHLLLHPLCVRVCVCVYVRLIVSMCFCVYIWPWPNCEWRMQKLGILPKVIYRLLVFLCLYV